MPGVDIFEEVWPVRYVIFEKISRFRGLFRFLLFLHFLALLAFLTLIPFCEKSSRHVSSFPFRVVLMELGPCWKQICNQEFSGNGDGNGVARLGLDGVDEEGKAEMNQHKYRF